MPASTPRLCRLPHPLDSLCPVRPSGSQHTPALTPNLALLLLLPWVHNGLPLPVQIPLVLKHWGHNIMILMMFSSMGDLMLQLPGFKPSSHPFQPEDLAYCLAIYIHLWWVCEAGLLWTAQALRSPGAIQTPAAQGRPPPKEEGHTVSLVPEPRESCRLCLDWTYIDCWCLSPKWQCKLKN